MFKFIYNCVFVEADVDKAVAAAQAAFARGSEWRNLQPAQRAALLNKVWKIVLLEVELGVDQ